MLGSLISAQVAGKVVGENATEVSSDYFRLSTGVYDVATVGGIQVTPSPTWLSDLAAPPAEESSGGILLFQRAKPSVALPGQSAVA